MENNKCLVCSYLSSDFVLGYRFFLTHIVFPSRKVLWLLIGVFTLVRYCMPLVHEKDMLILINLIFLMVSMLKCYCYVTRVYTTQIGRNST